MAGGKRRADAHSHARPHLGPLSRLGGHVLGIILGAAAWWYLVRAAIDFGHVALAGEPRAWIFTAAASAGAVGCLLLVIVLVVRVLVTLGVVSEYQPRRAAPRRRAEPTKGRPGDEAAATEHAAGEPTGEPGGPADDTTAARTAGAGKGSGRAVAPRRSVAPRNRTATSGAAASTRRRRCVAPTRQTATALRGEYDGSVRIPRVTSRRTRIAALLAVPCLLGLAGCGSSSSASPNSKSTDTPNSTSPGMPSSAEAYSVAGGKAFAANWVKQLNHATVTGDTTTLLSMSAKQCTVCTDFAQHLHKIYSAGGHVATNGWQVKSVIPIAGQTLKHPGFQVTVISTPQKVYASKGAKPQTYSGGQQGMRMFLERAHDHWLVDKIEIAQGG